MRKSRRPKAVRGSLPQDVREFVCGTAAEPAKGIQDRDPVDRRLRELGKDRGVGAGAPGVPAGVRTFLMTPWDRYIRTMPHPAHSARSRSFPRFVSRSSGARP